MRDARRETRLGPDPATLKAVTGLNFFPGRLMPPFPKTVTQLRRLRTVAALLCVALLAVDLTYASGGPIYTHGIGFTRGLVLDPNDAPIFAEFDANGIASSIQALDLAARRARQSEAHPIEVIREEGLSKISEIEAEKIVRGANEGGGVMLKLDRRSASPENLVLVRTAIVDAMKNASPDVREAFSRHTGQAARRWTSYVDEVLGGADDGYPVLDNLIQVVDE